MRPYKCYVAITGYQRNTFRFRLSYQHTIKRVAMDLLELCILPAMLRLNRQKIEAGQVSQEVCLIIGDAASLINVAISHKVTTLTKSHGCCGKHALFVLTSAFPV